ncbi:MAG: MBL fold metallo-hydrolase, partial [Rhodanobacter sp.]
GADLHQQIDAMVALAHAAHGQADRHDRLLEALTTLYATRAAAHGWTGTRPALQALLQTDIELNAQGLEVWLDRADGQRTTH